MIQPEGYTRNSGGKAEEQRDENHLGSKICRTERLLGKSYEGELGVKIRFPAGVISNATDGGGGIHSLRVEVSTLWPMGQPCPLPIFGSKASLEHCHVYLFMCHI